MKILQLTKKFPFPLKDGESIAVSNLSKSLVKQGCEITLLSMNTSKHFVQVNSLPSSYDHYQDIHTVYLDNRVTLQGAFLNLFRSESYHVSRFDFKAFHDKLIEILSFNSFDVIQMETLYLAPYIETIRKNSDAKIVMRSHNVEFEIWNRVVESTTFWPKKIYTIYLTKKLKRFEIARLRHYDLLVTVTQKDLDQYKLLGYQNEGFASPIGIDIKNYIPEQTEWSEKIQLSFIGSLDWTPNLDGLDWFISEVWPMLVTEYSDVELHIAGRNTPQHIEDLASGNIIIHGEVESAINFINAYPISIVPLLSGSGMRVKILEAMALGKVVVSTRIGAEGIDGIPNEEMILADTAQEFLQAIKYLKANPEAISKIGRRARSFISKEFDQNQNAKKLAIHYEAMVKFD